MWPPLALCFLGPTYSVSSPQRWLSTGFIVKPASWWIASYTGDRLDECTHIIRQDIHRKIPNELLPTVDSVNPLPAIADGVSGIFSGPYPVRDLSDNQGERRTRPDNTPLSNDRSDLSTVRAVSQ